MGSGARKGARGREGGGGGAFGPGEESSEFGEGAREGMGEGRGAGSRGLEAGRGGRELCVEWEF